MSIVINRFWSSFFCSLLISLFDAQFTHFFNLFSAIISFKIASSSSAILYHSFSMFIFTTRKDFSHLHVNFSVCMLFNLMSCSSTRSFFRIELVWTHLWSSHTSLSIFLILLKCNAIFFKFLSLRSSCQARRVNNSSVVQTLFHERICQIETSSSIKRTTLQSYKTRYEVISMKVLTMILSAHNTLTKLLTHFMLSSTVILIKTFTTAVWFLFTRSFICEW